MQTALPTLPNHCTMALSTVLFGAEGENMQKDSVADVLRSLATGDKSRSETARLRDVFPEVETALNAGVSRAAILEALHGQGFTMTLKSFESALYRIRKKRTQPAQAPQQKPAGEPQARITNPADIRKSRRRDIDLDDLAQKE